MKLKQWMIFSLQLTIWFTLGQTQNFVQEKVNRTDQEERWNIFFQQFSSKLVTFRRDENKYRNSAILVPRFFFFAFWYANGAKKGILQKVWLKHDTLKLVLHLPFWSRLTNLISRMTLLQMSRFTKPGLQGFFCLFVCIFYQAVSCQLDLKRKMTLQLRVGGCHNRRHMVYTWPNTVGLF